jgi:hypothetical protein
VYSVKSVSQVGVFSVGIGPIRLKLSGEAVGLFVGVARSRVID